MMMTELVPIDNRRRPWVEELEVDYRADRTKLQRDPSWVASDADQIEQQVLHMAMRDDDTGRALSALSPRNWYRVMQWLTGKDFGELHHAHSVDAKVKCRAQKMARGEYVRRPRQAEKDESQKTISA